MLHPAYRVVVCGSFHQDKAKLEKLLRELEASQCQVLSPRSIDFESASDMFVRNAAEASLSIRQIEDFHLQAIKLADFIWLHSPDGYVGTSGAFELGYACANQKPIFAHSVPSDKMLACYVRSIGSVFEAVYMLQEARA